MGNLAHVGRTRRPAGFLAKRTHERPKDGRQVPPLPRISRKTITRSIERQALAYQAQLAEGLWEAHKVTDMNHWIAGWECRTRILGTHGFNVSHTASNISAKLMKLRLGFGMEPRSRRPSSWTDLQWFQNEDPLDRPTITTDCGANISKGVEQHGLWDWSRCICHIIHNSVNEGLLEIEDILQVLKWLSTWMHRSSNAWRVFCQVQRSVHKEGRGIRQQTACISADESPDLGNLRRS